MNETNHICARDLINVGIFTAINVVIMFVIMPIGFMVYLMPLYCVLMPLVEGIPMMLFATKARKPGMYLIMEILMGIVLMVGGMGWYSLIPDIIAGILVELIVKSGNYRDVKKLIIGHGVFSIWAFGSFIPLIFMADAYWSSESMSGYSDEFVASAKALFQWWMCPVLIICCLVFGMLGAFIGTKVMKKHFIKAGLA